MAYSHARLRNTLAVVRILTGVLFLVFGVYKISSMEFARAGFPQFLWEATHGGGVGFYGRFLDSFVWESTGKYAILVGFVELFMGIGLLLGLVVRPIALLGMVYSVNLMLATWMLPGPGQPLWRYLDGEMRYIALFLLFLLLGVGHAGENWGLGAIYHHHRHLDWEKDEPVSPQDFAEENVEEENVEDDEAFPITSLPRRTY